VKEWGLEDDRCDGEGFGVEVYEDDKEERRDGWEGCTLKLPSEE